MGEIRLALAVVLFCLPRGTAPDQCTVRNEDADVIR
jgi:hypothetical protein